MKHSHALGLGAINVALGSATTGVFSNSNLAWTMLHQSGHATGDRVWRMPLWQHYGKQLSMSSLPKL